MTGPHAVLVNLLVEMNIKKIIHCSSLPNLIAFKINVLSFTCPKNVLLVMLVAFSPSG